MKEEEEEEDKDEEDEIDIECLRGALCETAAIDFTILARCTAIAFCLSHSDNDRWIRETGSMMNLQFCFWWKRNAAFSKGNLYIGEELKNSIIKSSNFSVLVMLLL